MIDFISFLQEIEGQEVMLNVSQIQGWLYKHKKDFENAIRTTSCEKWRSWAEYNIFPLPCLCYERDKNCLFIEIYKKLLDVLKVHKEELKYNYIVGQYKRVIGDEKRVIEWLKRYEATFNDDISFDGKVTVPLVRSINKNLILHIDKMQFINVLEFIEIFETNYYKIDKNYINY
ncbi:hypothetical protein [Flavobacterium agrisoli]|uniref:Uncharacterized protein n=1 Tax=Flavobacterium agrisoli TaxID=2793066 RepID=A0A934UJS5_9FLAO|nr:hypothetical protein [Flavobacterium agrisoli]MBK0369813.1 hypothetical protein [Flavobacterium agrisoli]